MEITLINKPTIQVNMPEEIYNRLLANVRSTDLEITFILSIEREEENTASFRVYECSFPPQWNEPAESKTLDSDYPKWCMEQIKSGIKLNGHGHSHPKMMVNPSGYDTNFFKQLIDDTNTFQFRLIVNQQGLIRCDLIDRELGFIVENIAITINCKGFDIIVDSTSFKFKITDTKNIQIYSLSDELMLTLKSHYLIASKNNIAITELDKKELIVTKRRYQTNEAIRYTTYTNPTYTGNQKTQPAKTPTLFTLDEDEGVEDDYMHYYNLERGYNDYGYKK